jgi:hypothetical protein
MLPKQLQILHVSRFHLVKIHNSGPDINSNQIQETRSNYRENINAGVQIVSINSLVTESKTLELSTLQVCT